VRGVFFKVEDSTPLAAVTSVTPSYLVSIIFALLRLVSAVGGISWSFIIAVLKIDFLAIPVTGWKTTESV
jgi:hypothetical protein